MTESPLELRASDGTPLAATLFAPEGKPNGAVLLAPAMAVTQRFYAPLARYLASQGFLALTLDLRGMGASRRKPLRETKADCRDWAERDLSAGLAALLERASALARGANLPITWIGHSFGAQVVPLVEGHDKLTKLVNIAAGSGYWRENVPQLRRFVWLLWYGFVPLLTPLFGYFPGAKLGMVGDVPRGAIEQWRRWCLNPDYLVGAEPGLRERYAAIRTPITCLSFTDDEMMSARNIESLHGFYSGAPKTMRRLDPKELGMPVGHFGFFRPQAEPLWRELLLPELAR